MQGSSLFLTSRQHKPSTSKHRHRVIKNINKPNSSDSSNNNQTLQLTGWSSNRPYTTSLLGRTQPIQYNYLKIEKAQEQLCKTVRQDLLSSYVRSKFRSLTSRHEQTIIAQKTTMKDSLIVNNSYTQDAQKLQKGRPKNIQFMKVCGMGLTSPTKLQKVLGQPYLVNAKQKLTRILSRKKQVQRQYQSIQRKVNQSKCEKIRVKKQQDKLFQNPQHVSSIEWDSEWRKDIQKQVRRYKNRLENRHQKHAYSMTIQW